MSAIPTPFDELAPSKGASDVVATPFDNFVPQAQAPDPSANIAVPDAGHIPGVMSFGNKVTPAQAAGGVAAGAVAGAAPLALSALPGVGEALLSHAEEQAGAWATKYPNLVSLGAKLGIPTGAAALLGWMIHQTKSK